MIEEPKIDEDAQSRQLAVYGHEAQAKLMAMRVFIHGLTGLSIEVAKNLILAGPKRVTLYDPSIVTLADLGRNFYIKQDHIGKVTRAHASIKFLRELNQNTHVEQSQTHQISEIVSNHDCVVVIDYFDKKYLIQLNKACRQKGVGFLYAGNLGLYGFTFVDFGEKHKVIDPTGEQEKNVHVNLITNEPEGVVMLHENKRHGLSDGDTVVFRQVKGMTQLNGKQFQVKVISPNSFSIGDTSKFGEYITGGIATQVKVPSFQSFNSLERSLSYPYAPGSTDMPICNWQHFGFPEQLHVILNGLLLFQQKHKRLPQNLSQPDADQLAQLCSQWQKNKISEQGFQFKVEQIEKKLINCVAKFCQTQISPVCSFLGGIITQQIIKLNGKYSPLRQWLHQEFFEIITDNHHINNVEPPKLSYLKTRYADYNILFGDKFVEKVIKSNTFLIGAGALGCQFIKMFALMGFSSAPNTRVLCTDDDNIQISNLNRQFLFRKKHVGRNKSQVACKIGRKINTECNFQSIKVKVCPDSEHVFNDQFWEGLDLVVNAVDNIKARQYIDDRCVWFEKPFFESGTLGTKCHSQIVIPHHTLSYNDIKDPPEQQIAVCTLKLFPYQIQHTIQWARQYFETVIAIPTQDLKDFYASPKQFLDKIMKENKRNPSIAKDRLNRMKRLHEINVAQTFDKCVEVSIRAFEEAFQNQIAQLLQAFPENYISPDTGKPYWSGLKRLPQVIKISTSDNLHIEFIQAMSNILAHSFGISQQKSKENIVKYIKNVQPIPFSPRKIKLKIDESKSDNSAMEQEPLEEDGQEIADLLDNLHKIEVNEGLKRPEVVAFQKDDPTNWHIQFMGGVSNLRARNYRIQQVNNFKVKLIAGKIIPAIATATALIVGAVGVQIIKYILQNGEMEFKEGFYKNLTVNLALPLFVFNDPLLPLEISDKQFDPIMCQPVRAVPAKYTKWEKISVQGPLTMAEFKQTFEKKFDISISSISVENCEIYVEYGPNAKVCKERMNMKIEEVFGLAKKTKIGEGKKYLQMQINSSDKNGVTCFTPDFKYKL